MDGMDICILYLSHRNKVEGILVIQKDFTVVQRLLYETLFLQKKGDPL